MKILSLLIFGLVLSPALSAQVINTSKGKIEFTQGHFNPKCRIVSFKSNDTGEVSRFRIDNDEGSKDILSITLSALIANRDVTINYNPSQTTGCGNEPKIRYVTVF